MLKKATVIATLAMTTMAASAQEENRVRTYDELAPVVVKYAEALGCGGDGELDALGQKNIARFDVYGLGDEGPSTYVAAVNADFGCYGGSGTTRGHLVVLEVQTLRPSAPTYVLPELSEPIANSVGAPPFFTSLYVKNGQLHATSIAMVLTTTSVVRAYERSTVSSSRTKSTNMKAVPPNGTTRGIS